jgi:hypothetical protein
MPQPEQALSTSLRYWRIARAAEPTDPTVLIGLVEAGWIYSKITSSALEDDVMTALREGLELTAGPDADPVLRNRFLTHAGIGQ